MIICKRQPSTKCYICGEPITSLCDATRKDGKPCDIPMCDNHRNRITTDVDVCRYHNYPKYIEQALENRILREKARWHFVEECKKQNIRVLPGHHPDFSTKEEVDEWIAFRNSLRELFDETNI